MKIVRLECLTSLLSTFIFYTHFHALTKISIWHHFESLRSFTNSDRVWKKSKDRFSSKLTRDFVTLSEWNIDAWDITFSKENCAMIHSCSDLSYDSTSRAHEILTRFSKIRAQINIRFFDLRMKHRKIKKMKIKCRKNELCSDLRITSK